MGKCDVYIQEIRFDTRDKDLTQVYVLVHDIGDCPFQLRGWHHKTFPSKINAVEILEKHISNHLKWPLKAPEE